MTDPAATDGVIFAVPVEALEPLGAHRLALLVSELTEIDERVARRARIEIADLSGPAAVAEVVAAQMERLARDATFFDWREVGELARDVDMLREAIATKITPREPELGLAMLWRLMALAGPIHERAHDHGEIGAVFDDACHDIARAAAAGGCAPGALAARVVEALQTDTHGRKRRVFPLLPCPELICDETRVAHGGVGWRETSKETALWTSRALGLRAGSRFCLGRRVGLSGRMR